MVEGLSSMGPTPSSSYPVHSSGNIHHGSHIAHIKHNKTLFLDYVYLSQELSIPCGFLGLFTRILIMFLVKTHMMIYVESVTCPQSPYALPFRSKEPR